MNDIVDTIKRGTHGWHGRVEERLPVFGECLSLSEYQRLLEIFHGFHAGFETALGGVPRLEEVLSDWRDRLKLRKIEEDLFWLGYAESDLARLEVCAPLPRLDSHASVFGALYVTESFTLSGALVCGRLARILELFPGQGASFFGAYRESAGRMWKAFRRSLHAFATPENEHLIVQSAMATFEALWFWISHCRAAQPGSVEAVGTKRAALQRHRWAVLGV